MTTSTTPTFTFIIIGSGWWGAGNSIEEAKAHAPNWVVTELTGYEVLEFDTPIFDIECNTLGGLTWTYEGSTLGDYTVTEVEPCEVDPACKVNPA